MTHCIASIAALGEAIGELRRLSDEAYTAPTYERCRDIWLEKRPVEDAYKLGLFANRSSVRGSPQDDFATLLKEHWQRTGSLKARVLYHEHVASLERGESHGVRNNRVSWEHAQFIDSVVQRALCEKRNGTRLGLARACAVMGYPAEVRKNGDGACPFDAAFKAVKRLHQDFGGKHWPDQAAP